MNQIGAKRFIPYLYILPIILVSGLFLYYSIGFTFYASLHEWNGIDESMKFIGLHNFIEMFSDPNLYGALSHNLLYFAGLLTIQTVLGLLMAVLLRAKLFGHTFFKALYFLPSIMAAIIVAGIFRILMDTNMGSINKILTAVGLDFFAISWLGDPRFALMSIIIVAAFQWTGFSMVLYYAGLLAIPDEIYESAKIDGAGFWTTMLKITFPMVAGTTTTNLILGITGSLKTFDIVVLMTNGGPGRTTEFLNTLLYKEHMNYFKGGYASAIGVFILILALTLSIGQIKVYERSQKDM